MRNVFWDQIRGVAIIAVVAIHASSASGTFPTESANFQFGMALRQLIDFAVPMFLAVAGYFAGLKPIASPVDFVRSRFLRILPPYLFWTAVYVLVLKRGDLFSLTALARDVIAGTGIGIGYFVIVLLQMVVLTPIIDRIKSRWLHILIMITGTILGLATTYLLQVILDGSSLSRFPFYALPFFVWYPFYHLGFVTAKWRLAENRAFQSWQAVFLGLWLVGLALSASEALVLVAHDLPEFAASQIKASSILASLALFLWVASRSERGLAVKASWLAWLGRNSYFVYLTHLLTFVALVPILQAMPALFGIQPLYIAVLTALSLLVCAGAARLGELRLPRPLQLRLMGI